MGLFRHSVKRLDKGMDPKPEAVKTLVERKFHEPRPTEERKNSITEVSIIIGG